MEAMSEEEQLNWVEKRHRAEKHLADAKAGLWHDICAALTDASRSFNKLYGGASEATAINGHRFRIVQGNDRIDIDYDDQSGRISTSRTEGPFHFRHFDLRADYLSAFIVDDKDNRVTADEVSQSILASSFFPR